MSTLLSGPLAHAIGWALVHLLWQGVLVAAILAAALALLQKQSANARYLAACGALVLLVALGIATAAHVYEPATATTYFVNDTTTGTTYQIADETRAAAAPSSSSTWADVVAFANSHLPQFVLAWMVGVLLLSVRLMFGWIRAHRIATKNASEATPQWQQITRRLAQALRIRGAIRLLESAAVEVPTVIGFLRPVVLLPVATLSGLSAEQMEMVLAHELAHIRRHDFLINLLQAVVETLLFYHPAVWWISGRIRAEREHCCDDIAVAVSGNPLLYARALTRLEELRVDPAQAFVAANGGSLLTRIRRLCGARAEAPNGPSRWAAGAALLTVLAALLVTPSLPLRASDDQLPQTPPAPKAKATTHVHSKTAKCDVDVVAPTPDADDPDVDVDIDVDDPPTPMPAIASTPMPAVHIAPMAIAAPAIRAVVANAPVIAAAVANGVRGGIVGGVDGGIEGGIEGGIVGGIQTTPEPPETPAAPRAPRYRVREHRHIGENGKLTVDDLIALRTAGVTPAYIDEMRRSAGLGDLSLDDIAAMRIQGVTPQYISAMRNAGLKINDAETIIALKIQGVSPEYIDSMRAAGYANLSTRELIELRTMGVTPGYVKQLSEAGYRNLAARDLTSLRAMGVTPEFIKSLADAGYTNLNVKDLIRLAASGVNSDFIRDLARYRTK
jgi:beta-lactamase regulating signal transducer with metallopeptidase domain